MSKWWHIKAFSTKRPANVDRPHEQDFITATTVPINGISKRGLDMAVVNQNLDAFARLRVSNLTTLFDSKQINDKMPLYWDDQEVTGTGTTSTYNTNQASTTLSVGNLTAGKRVRQTFQRFNYQPGKSQLMIFTTRVDAVNAGITSCVGQFDDKNGLFFRLKDGVISIVIRTYTSGAAIDTSVDQSDWNMDKMDGAGISEVTLDPTKAQILFMDYEWLGVGRVRFGVFVHGVPHYVHSVYHANTVNKVYMSTPNLPLRYEIENDGTGPASNLLHICSTISSEGGKDHLGILRHEDSGSISGLSTGNHYALMGIRLKSTHIDVSVLLATLSAMATSVNDKVHWELVFNPTVAGTFTYNDITNSAVQIAKGSSSNIVTGGIVMDGGYFTDSIPAGSNLANALRLGSAIDGTVDEIILMARPVTNNITVEGSLTWRELS